MALTSRPDSLLVPRYTSTGRLLASLRATFSHHPQQYLWFLYAVRNRLPHCPHTST
ncbi:hypothetical protein [Collinsella aerofaciens]|uniref:hypothetical protein n=1 Tax=Collinsella aerofaciens TaxID=74426 RepID=UPI00138A03D7|nr:hypothetical protein [Collinsella aerofaciens]